jgi:hypothetical protein
LHIADQAGTGVASLQQIVAENSIFRETASADFLECVDVVDSLANKGTFIKQILIDIRYGPRVRIDSRFTCEEADKPTPPGTGKIHGDARLQNRIPFGKTIFPLIEPGPIQRMGHRADQLAGRIARKLRVTVERYFLFD